MSLHRLLILSDLHFFNPDFHARLTNTARDRYSPSRLSTELALGDKKANPFFALLRMVRDGHLEADSLICSGDLTTCADPTAMNLGWLQLHRLSDALGTKLPLMTAGNHDVDSRFQTSTTSPRRMLTYLDPPFPVDDDRENACYWANGYCIVDQGRARFVLVNSCSLHGYETETDRQSDHGHIPETLLSNLRDDLNNRDPVEHNFLLCHHHPVEIEGSPGDVSIIANGSELVTLLESMSPPNWIIIHGHRHLPGIRYATSSPRSPVVFSAGSFAANLDISLQGRTQNQFYEVEVDSVDGSSMGRYRTWSWDQNEGVWQKGWDTLALAASGGFGYRPDPVTCAAEIEPLVPPESDGTITWGELEIKLPRLRYVLPAHREAILKQLADSHRIDHESDVTGRNYSGKMLRLGRRQ